MTGIEDIIKRTIPDNSVHTLLFTVAPGSSGLPHTLASAQWGILAHLGPAVFRVPVGSRRRRRVLGLGVALVHCSGPQRRLVVSVALVTAAVVTVRTAVSVTARSQVSYVPGHAVHFEGVTLNRQDQISVFPIIVAAKCYRLVPPIESGPRSLAVWFSIHTWRYGVRIPGGSDTFLNAIGELFSIAVGFRSGKVSVG